MTTTTQTAPKSTGSKWTHKVVKMQRGMRGEWFARAAAFTGSLDECQTYAAAFAAEQAGVAGTRITVQTRGGKVVESITVLSA